MRTCPEGSLQVKLMVHRATAVADHHTKPQLLEPRSTRSPHCRLAAELAADHDAAWFFHFGLLNHFSYQYRIFPSPHGQYPSVHAAERRPPSRDRSLLTTNMLVPFGPVCQRCESTDADSLKATVQQQQDDAMLDHVGLCRVWRVTQSSRGCASWLGVRALSSSPTPLARYRTCVQVWRRCSILGEVSVQCTSSRRRAPFTYRVG